jgi:hypothetical protein
MMVAAPAADTISPPANAIAPAAIRNIENLEIAIALSPV